MVESRAHTTSFVRANIMGILLSLPITALYASAYVYFYNIDTLVESTKVLKEHPILTLGIIVGGIFLHEGIHGLFLKYAGGKSWRFITFGFSVKGFSPYVHCKEPLKVGPYRLGIAMPALLLGIIPFVISLLVGSALLAWFGFLFTVSAAGDFIILWLIRNVDEKARVQDHPSRVGCTVVEG